MDFFVVFINYILYLTDVVSIPKTNENFRLLYDTKGRFRLHSVRDEEAKVLYEITPLLLYNNRIRIHRFKFLDIYY